MTDLKSQSSSDQPTLTGQCVCGEVKFSLRNDFRLFYQCHCKQCQQQTGTAFASNLFTTPNNINWLKGGESVTQFSHATRDFSNGFCKLCGSPVPYITKSGESLIVPAGCLDEFPQIRPKANIFFAEQAAWLQDGMSATKHDGFEK